jgi:hypothetical protein
MTTKLSPAMSAALRDMAQNPDGLGSAYQLGCSMGTMRALSAREYIEAHSWIGWVSSPQTCDWRITAKGRAAIAKAECRND